MIDGIVGAGDRTVAAGVQRFELKIDIDFFAGLNACEQTLVLVFLITYPQITATRFFFRSFVPSSLMSASTKPPSRKRLAIASAAVVTLPTESVVLISMSCLKISRESCLV